MQADAARGGYTLPPAKLGKVKGQAQASSSKAAKAAKAENKQKNRTKKESNMGSDRVVGGVRVLRVRDVAEVVQMLRRG